MVGRLNRFSKLVLVPGVVALSVGACAYRQEKGGAAGTAPHVNSQTPSFAQVRDQVFAPKCTSCHTHQYEFSDYQQTFAKRDDIKLKVFGDHSMPKGDTLSPAQSALLEAWLDGGAPETPAAPDTSASPAPRLAPSWENVQKKFFGPYCLSCHSGPKPKHKLDLADRAQICDNIQDVMDSIFLPVPMLGNLEPMPRDPKVRASLGDDEKALLVDWIEAGMPDANGNIEPPEPRPSAQPSAHPSAQPSAMPSAEPSVSPSAEPSPEPLPSTEPSTAPSIVPLPAVPSFAQVRDQVFAVSCSTCHYHTGDFADYSSTYDERADILKKVFVDGSMPKTGTLSDAQRSLLKAWLDGGAPENGGFAPVGGP